ncbi:MAG: hypothetical protein IJS02_01750, partial [Bacteroidales bacterium]|nr:hypothetical protein [Bacteroidales bacterium]
VKCYNTDYYGVKNILSQFILHFENVLVIGCGGAGKAAALAAYDSGFCVSVANRTPEKAKSWVEENHLNDIECYGLDSMPVTKSDIIIYTVPVLPDRLAKASFNGKILIEANYATPVFADSPLLSAYISGEEWLKEQAHFGFKIMREKYL